MTIPGGAYGGAFHRVLSTFTVHKVFGTCKGYPWREFPSYTSHQLILCRVMSSSTASVSTAIELHCNSFSCPIITTNTHIALVLRVYVESLGTIRGKYRKVHVVLSYSKASFHK